MFKLKALSIGGILFLTLLMSASFVSGSLVSDISNLYQEAKEMSTLQDAFGPGSLGGVYDAHLHIAQDNAAIAGVEAIDEIYANYSSLAGCQSSGSPLRKTDIITVLLQSPADLSWLDQLDLDTGDLDSASDGLAQGCQRIGQCMGKGELGIQTCKQIIFEDYSAYLSQGESRTSLTTDFYGTQFYANGTLDDSTYDLMVDMQLIGDLMFKDNTTPEEEVYYRMPTSMQPSMPQTPSGTNAAAPSADGRPNSDSDGVVIENDTLGNIRIGSNPSMHNTLSESLDSQSGTDLQDEGGSDDVDPITKSLVAAIDTQVSVPPSTQTISGVPLFDNSLCLTDTHTDPSDQTHDSATPALWGDDELSTEEVDEIRQDYMDYINGQYTSYTPFTPEPDAPIIRPSGESSSIGSALDDMGLMDEINSCINTCNEQYSGMDALTCKASCLCQTTPESSDQEYNKYLDFKIKFCWVPTAVEAPYTSVMRVQSIEEIVDAMNTTLTALRQSGALNKRNETQEYLDTTLRHLNLADSFVFSFNIAFKTNVNTKNDDAIQKEADKAFEQATDRSLIYSHSSNKYSLTNIDNAMDDASFQKSIKHAMSIIDNIIDRQTMMTNTLKAHNEFWRQFELSAHELTTITESMMTKAKNGS